MLFCVFKFCLNFNYSNSVLLLPNVLLQIYPVCATVLSKKQRGFYWFIEENQKIQHTIKFLSSRERPRVLLRCAAPAFLLFHYSLFLKCVNNFEISCQDDEFTIKVEFAL